MAVNRSPAAAPGVHLTTGSNHAPRILDFSLSGQV